MKRIGRGRTTGDPWSGGASGPWASSRSWPSSGFASFGRNPELLARFPGLAGFYAGAFGLFARGHVLIAAAVLMAVLVRYSGWAWLAPFAAVCGVALLAEWVGTSTGLPFGEYRYTELLGPKIDGKVPWLIPVSWFLMALPSFALAAGKAGPRISQWFLGAVVLTAWDLSLDPAMSYLSPYWVWETEGALYGMPLLNVLGWLVTGVVLMAVLDATGARGLVAAAPRGFLAGYYLTVLAMSFGMVLVSGLWISVALTLPLVLWVSSQFFTLHVHPDPPGLAHPRGATS